MKLLVLAAALAWGSGAQAPQGISVERQRLLTEMRKRRITAPDAVSWSPEQYTQLLRAREAEALGAFALLRAKLGTLRGFAVEHRQPDGFVTLWLTKRGYEQFVFLHSQDARAYFEAHGSEARWVFQTRSVQGKKLFDRDGILTQEGLDVYNRIGRGLEVFWKLPDGRLTGTVRPPKGGVAMAGPTAADKPAAKGGAASEESRARDWAKTLLRSGYEELSFAEVRFLFQQTKLGEEQLKKESSLQVIPTREKVYYLLAPSDPLMAVVARFRQSPAPAK